MEKDNYFVKLYSIDCSGKIEKKNGLSYLSWAWAWAEAKKVYPDANFKVYERETEYGPVNYFTDGKTCWVKTGVTISGIEHIEYLPVMDYKNNSIPLEKVTSFDVNKSVQRSLTKALGRHGLGLFVYAGEDLPEAVAEERKADAEAKKAEAEKLANIKATPKQIVTIRKSLNDKGIPESAVLQKYKLKTLEELTAVNVANVMKDIEVTPAKKKEEPKKTNPAFENMGSNDQESLPWH